MFILLKAEMAKLNNKERDYIGILQVSHDPQQSKEGGIDVTYNIVNWLRANNLMKGELKPESGVINFKKEMGGTNLKDLVEKRLYISNKEPKYQKGLW